MHGAVPARNIVLGFSRFFLFVCIAFVSLVYHIFAWHHVVFILLLTLCGCLFSVLLLATAFLLTYICMANFNLFFFFFSSD